MSKCVSLLPEQSREPRGRSPERPAPGVVLCCCLRPPARPPAESMVSVMAKGQPGRLQSQGEGKGCLGLPSLRTWAPAWTLAARVASARLVEGLRLL